MTMLIGAAAIAPGWAHGVNASAPAAAEAETVSDSFSIDVALDAPGSGELAAFDPALGTLTQVNWSTSADVLIQVCAENLSAESGTTTGGPAVGELIVDYPGGTLTTASASLDIPATNLSASNGADDCLDGFDDTARMFPAAVGASDVAYAAQTDTATDSGSIIDADALGAFVGPVTVPFSWTSSSNADIIQPSEWDIWFVAEGSLSVTVEYEYLSVSGAPTTTTVPCVPPGGTSSTVPGGGTGVPGTTMPTCPEPPPCLDPGDTLAPGVSLAPGATVPPCTTTPQCLAAGATLPPGVNLPPGSTIATCELPSTGAASDGWLRVAVVLVLAGAGVVGLAGLRRRRPTTPTQ